MDEEFIRNRITELRLKKGVSEYQMSMELGQNRSYIQAISSGRSMPSMKQFLNICEYFEITPLQFFDAQENNPQLKVYACGTLAGIVLTTTKVNEFLSAMNRVHAPKKLVIPMAVMLRYIPTIQEDWRYIKDAMRMRDVSPSLAGFLAHPGMTVECIYVPLLMAASKAADDLSVASVTRGIENPNPRTCLVQIKCGVADWGVMAVAVAYLIFELCVRGGVIG